VNYETQCPKGHSLISCSGSACDSAQHLCRVCHKFTECKHACKWLVCSVTGCCGTFSVCNTCIALLQHTKQVSHAASASDSLSPSLVCPAVRSNFFHIHSSVLQGVSVQYLRWLKDTLGPFMGRLTTEQVCQSFIKPRTSRSHSSLISELLLEKDTKDHVGDATWFISHVWSNPFTDTLDSILLFFEGRDDAATAKVWIDILVDGQHSITGPSKPSSWYMTTFRDKIHSIGKLLLIVDKWNDPSALKRAWFVSAFTICKLLSAADVVVGRCVLELGAIAMKKEQGQFAVAMTTEERLHFLQSIINRGEYNKMLGTVNAETSDCTRPEDRKTIHDAIREKIGFGKLNRMVLGVLEVWIEEQLQSQVVCCEKAGQSAEAIKWKAVVADLLSDQGRYNGALEIKKQVLELCYASLPANDPAIGKKMMSSQILLVSWF
jgi:hypothetical protein